MNLDEGQMWNKTPRARVYTFCACAEADDSGIQLARTPGDINRAMDVWSEHDLRQNAWCTIRDLPRPYGFQLVKWTITGNRVFNETHLSVALFQTRNKANGPVDLSIIRKSVEMLNLYCAAYKLEKGSYPLVYLDMPVWHPLTMSEVMGELFSLRNCVTVFFGGVMEHGRSALASRS